MGNNREVFCVIMAGGAGTRFWPKSRKHSPKQFLDILGTGKTFIRSTYERFAGKIPPQNFLVVTNAGYRDLTLEHLPELQASQVLCEPIGRNTAPCICYAAYKLYRQNPDAVMIVTPSDHLVMNEAAFQTVIDDAVAFVEQHDVLMTIGINPTHPETGYGYIQRSNGDTISRVKCFTEKPSLELAQTFIRCGEFLWNSGIFIWKVADIIAAIERHLPELHALFDSIADKLGTDDEPDAIGRVYAECRSISIDYGVMEHADNVYVRSGDFGWSDVGTWGSLYRYSRKDKYANVKPAEGCYTYETRNSIISLPENKIAIINGLRDYIVVDTEDVLMICPRSEEQNIRKYVDEVKYHTGDKHC